MFQYIVATRTLPSVIVENIWFFKDFFASNSPLNYDIGKMEEKPILLLSCAQTKYSNEGHEFKKRQKSGKTTFVLQKNASSQNDAFSQTGRKRKTILWRWWKG